MEYYMMNIKRFILKIRLFFSPIFVRHKRHQEKGFIYEFDDEEFKKLTLEEQGKEVQKDWNRYMREK